MSHRYRTDRRTALRLTAAALPAVLAGCTGATEGGTEPATPTPTPTPGPPDGSDAGNGDGGRDAGNGDGGNAAVDEWLAAVSNYDGVADRTGAGEVRVIVGAEANGGNFGYAPAAVRVDPGTTVVWEWTGNGGAHNVVDREGRYESELVTEAGHTYSHAVSETSLYYCKPHRSLHMQGAVVVG